MKNKDLIASLQKRNPEADVVIFLDPSSDEYITLSIDRTLFVKGTIIIQPGEPVSRSSDWDERHPGWPEGGRIMTDDEMNWRPEDGN
jgi:hypothetical protein